MNLKFEIKFVESGKRAALYTIQFEDEATTEYNQFLSNPKNRACADFQPLRARLDDLINRYGFQQRFFKYESSPNDPIQALHYENKRLRLYCWRLSEKLMVAGNGGVKEVARYEDDRFLLNCVDRLKYFDRRYLERRQDKEIGIILAGNVLGFDGNPIFERE